MKKLAKFRYAFLGLTILVCLTALHLFTGLGVHYTRNEPKESDVVGVYRPDLKTRILISWDSDVPATNCEIKLNAAGKIELIGVMIWLTEDETNIAGVRLVSTKGSWHLERVGKYWQIVWGIKMLPITVFAWFEKSRLTKSRFITGKPVFRFILCETGIDTGFPFTPGESSQTGRACDNTSGARPCGQ